jgi:anti-anti-sigma regulatory factor
MFRIVNGLCGPMALATTQYRPGLKLQCIERCVTTESLSRNRPQSLSPMVFSFFKKPPSENKMTARPTAVARPQEGKGAGSGAFVGTHLKPQPAGLAPGDKLADSRQTQTTQGPLTISDFVFSETSTVFQIELDVDPVDAMAEEAAMQYANGQDGAARQVLENAVRVHRSGEGERLWLLLFDFFQLTGEQKAFDALSIEYARCFEKSPPVWRESATAVAAASARSTGYAQFKGDLEERNNDGFLGLRDVLEKTPSLRLDLSKVRALDAGGCERLIGLLHDTRRRRRDVELLGIDEVDRLLDDRVTLGCAQDRGCWLLKLEFCQLRGQLEAFEDLAINYAVTFEISPPSWEPGRVAEIVPAALTLAVADSLTSEAYSIKGDVKSARFADLPAFAATNDPVLVDCSGVTRMDFLSAGALLNVLTTVKRSGRRIIFRHPHRLLAELFRVVGLKAIADIDFVKN